MTQGAAWVLCALYLQFNSTTPELRTKLYKSEAECKVAAQQYVQRKADGEAKALCWKVKQRKEAH